MQQCNTQYIVSEHRDLQVNTMGVDYHGQLALLAGRRNIAFVDLNHPDALLYKVPLQSKWQIDAVQWNPHSSHAQYFVTTCNQRADVWTFENHQCNLHGSLKAHTRVISNLDWSPHDPNTLATCSVDTYTHLWDFRDRRKPRQSLQGIAGVSQVKWNKHNAHLLATCHDGDIRVWDARKGKQPVQYITGHLSKIYGLDWSPLNQKELATSSQDGSVKFWNIEQPRRSTNQFCPSQAPVWRARYTPFGRGLATVVVSPLRRGENNLSLWNLDDLNRDVYTFVGHSDVVLEFQWRHVQGHYQLVTWSKDQTLRIWPINANILKRCGVDMEFCDDEPISTDNSTQKSTASSNQSGTMSGSGYNGDYSSGSAVTTVVSNEHGSSDVHGSSIADMEEQGAKLAVTPPNSRPRLEEVHSPHHPRTLQQEFALVNFDVNNVKVEEADAHGRKCTVSAADSSGQHVLTLTMHFPHDYPNNVPPTFMLVDNSPRAGGAHIKNIIISLNSVALQHVSYNRSCIEPCLRELVSALEKLQIPEESNEDASLEPLLFAASVMPRPSKLGFHHPAASFQPYQDKAVPFPRTSGARFGGSGYLICFTRKTDPIRKSISTGDVHPRALGDLSFGQQGGRTPSRHGQPLFGLHSTLSSTPPGGSISSDIMHKWYDYKDTKQNKRSRSKSRNSTSRQDSLTKLEPSFSGSGLNSLGGVSMLGGGATSPKKSTRQRSLGPVIIYDVHCIMPINRNLAENYTLDTDRIEQMCSRNSELAHQEGRQDLVQLWSLVALTVPPARNPSLDPTVMPWAVHPFGRTMLQSLLDHYSSLHDVQTLAMLTCAIGSKYNPDCPHPTPLMRSGPQTNTGKTTSDYTFPRVSQVAHSNYTPYHTIHTTDSKEWSFITKSMKRSNSLSDMRELDPITTKVPTEKEIHLANLSLTDAYEIQKYDQFKYAYAEILYRMGMLNQRSQVLKYVSSLPEPHTGIEFKTRCHYCQEETRGVQCFHSNCKQMALQCVLCHVAVRGSSSFCLACGHGGHTEHMMHWFKTHDICPSGCGCNCLQANPMNAGNED